MPAARCTECIRATNTTGVHQRISEKEGYGLYRQTLSTYVLTRREMAGVNLKTILKASEAALILLKTNLQRPP